MLQLPAMRPQLRALFSSSLLLFSLLTLSFSATSWAVEFGISRPAALGSDYQSYFERPDILQVSARPHPSLHWQDWRQAHLEAAAAFLELYPTEHLYFLARDAELLYDAVRLISRDDPQTLARLHLINVSRANMRDSLLFEYLAQEGLTVERLRTDASFQPIFIDTGFSGTIPRVISEQMPQNVRKRLRTHLLVSSNDAMPSLRSFLLPINPAINQHHPSSMHGTIVGYEHIPRATARSTRYRRIQDEVHPVSSLTEYSDGEVNASIALQYQEDLKSFLENPAGKRVLKERRQLWKKLRTDWTALSREQWIDALKLMMSSSASQIEAAIRDFLEWVSLIGRHVNSSAPNILIEDIGASTGAVTTQLSNKEVLIALFPQWTPILEDPESQIPALLESGQIGTLGAILDVVEDEEIIGLALDAIATRLSTASVYALAEALIENSSNKTWIIQLFERPETATHPELLRLAIEKTTPESMGCFAWIFKQSHWKGQLELLRLAVEKAAPDEMGEFSSLFHDHLINLPDLFRLGLEKASAKAMSEFAHIIFSKPASANSPELLRLAIEKSLPQDMYAFIQWVFSMPHWSNQPELLRRAIERTAPGQLRQFADHVFNRTHWSSHPQIETFRAATQIDDSARRAEYLRAQLGPYSWETSAPATAPATTLAQTPAPASASAQSIEPGLALPIGARVRTDQGRTLEILNEPVSGKRGRVYRARDVASGEILALKIAVNSAAETLESIQSETQKTERWAQLGINHAPILEIQSAGHYVVRPWIEGVRADAWIRQWAEQGAPRNALPLIRLRQLIHRVAQQSAYIGDLNPKNLIWTKNKWIIIDSGGISDRPVEESLERFISSISRRWLKALKKAQVAEETVTFCEKQMLKALK